MRRREFITLLGGVAVGWPLAALAQQPERIRRIGVLMNFRANDPEGQARVTAFVQGLQKLGWTEGSNVQDIGRNRVTSHLCQQATSARRVCDV
jgi:putative ABC transport system substrate-binding protein